MGRRSGQVYLEGIRKASASCTERSDDETWVSKGSLTVEELQEAEKEVI